MGSITVGQAQNYASLEREIENQRTDGAQITVFKQLKAEDLEVYFCDITPIGGGDSAHMIYAVTRNTERGKELVGTFDELKAMISEMDYQERKKVQRAVALDLLQGADTPEEMEEKINNLQRSTGPRDERLRWMRTAIQEKRRERLQQRQTPKEKGFERVEPPRSRTSVSFE